MNEIVLLGRIAWRNLTASFLNVIIGVVLLAGTFLFVVGGSLISSVDEAMSRSIVGSATGHLQAYSADSEDSPALFDNFNLPDLAAIPDFAKVKGALAAHPNVKAVVPMGVGTAMVAYGNTADEALERLRKAYGDRPHADPSKLASLKTHVRQIVRVIRGDYGTLAKVATASALDPKAEADLEKADSEAFWRGFDAAPFSHLEFLENRIAGLLPDADQAYLHYVGTDLGAFTASFDRLRIVDGCAVPPGRRGMLLSKFVYESMFKLKTAHRLDQIHEALTVQGRRIDSDPDLRQWVEQNRTQTREIVLQLDPQSAEAVAAVLRAETHSVSGDMATLLGAFLDTDDASFERRYRLFYEDIAPHLELYRLKPGENLTIKAYAKNGFLEAVSVPVYGTFEFEGLEKSDLAGSLSLMDLMSFRDLYGYVTPEKAGETSALEREAGVRTVRREDAEAELFGGGGSLVSVAHPRALSEKAELGDLKERLSSEALAERVYSQSEIDAGVALQAAVILKDPSRLKGTLGELEGISRTHGLGLKFADWQKAAGNIGQFVWVANVVLGLATGIIFVVALVIINNAVVMATLQRVREIGTLRAIGAPKGFVWAMVLAETATLGLVFGSAGALAGTAAVVWLGHAGIPAFNEVLYFFFSGPRLYPTLSWGSVAGAFTAVLFVTCASALYPAVLATRVQPVQAMASED